MTNDAAHEDFFTEAILTEDLITLPQASKSTPGHPHLSTFHRWIKKGVRGVQLESLLVGGKRYTSREALSRFFRATTAAADGARIRPLDGRRESIE